MGTDVLLVDSSYAPTQQFVGRVRARLGDEPIAAWAGYLRTGGRARADSLTTADISILHQFGIAVLPIYNDAWRYWIPSGAPAAADDCLYALELLRWPRGLGVVLDIDAQWPARLGASGASWWRSFEAIVSKAGYRLITYATVTSADAMEVAGPLWVAAWDAPHAPEVGVKRSLFAWQSVGRAFGDLCDLSRLYDLEPLWRPETGQSIARTRYDSALNAAAELMRALKALGEVVS